MEVKDVTGTPRPERDVRAALTFIEREMVNNPLASGKDGTPCLIHYTVIRDALRELLALRH